MQAIIILALASLANCDMRGKVSHSFHKINHMGDHHEDHHPDHHDFAVHHGPKMVSHSFHEINHLGDHHEDHHPDHHDFAVQHGPSYHPPSYAPPVKTTYAHTPAPPTYKPAPPTYKPAPPTYKPAPPTYKPAPKYHEPKYEAYPAKYNYAYEVQDHYGYSPLSFGADEARDGYAASGNYHVLLPDGRKQTVTYSVDGYGGYVADVSYEGEAQYPEHHKPSYHEPAKPYHG